MFERTWWKPWTWAPIGAIITREPEWSTADIDWMLASRDFEASIGAHGHPLDETTSRDANPANSEGGWYYVADAVPTTDFAARAGALAADRWREQYKDESMAGMFFPIRKVWRTPR